MRKRIWITAAATALAVAITTTWAGAGRRPGSQEPEAPAGFVLTKAGWVPDPSIPHYEVYGTAVRDALREEWSGCTLYADLKLLSKEIDQASFEALAALFRAQEPIPPDRLQHFAWTDQAKDVVSFVGWGASIRSAVRQGDDWLLEVSVTPRFECETAIGGLVYDQYYETYVVRDGWFEYQGGRSPEIVRHIIHPDPGRLEIYSFD